MNAEERFAWVRNRAMTFKRAAPLSQTTRGCMTGRLTKAIKSAADAIGLPTSNVRDIRLALAQGIFGRLVESFNGLVDCELWAIDQWVGRNPQSAHGELVEWLREKYGEQTELEGL